MLRVAMTTLLLSIAVFMAAQARMTFERATAFASYTEAAAITPPPTPLPDMDEAAPLECFIDQTTTVTQLVDFLLELDEDTFAAVMSQVYDRLNVRKGL